MTTPARPDQPGRPDLTKTPKPPVQEPSEPNRRIFVEHAGHGFDKLRARRRLRAHQVLVLLTTRGRYRLISAENPLTAGELLWQRVRSAYEVNIGEYQASISEELPSAGDAFRFVMTMDFRWSVTSPLDVVRRNITDTAALLAALRPVALQRMREISRRYPVTESAAAEAELNRSLLADPLGSDLGLTIDTFVRLSLESATD